ERGQDRRQVALPLERRPRDRSDPGVELAAHDVRQARLPEPRRPDEENVVERFPAAERGLQGDVELLLDPLLADELGQPPRAQRAVELILVDLQRGREEAGAHAARLRASLTRSSGGSSGSISARARSASIRLYPSSTSASRAARSALGSVATAT